MPLLDSEVQRIKYELGYNLITIDGEPYVGFTALFEQVIQPYLQSGADTMSQTTIGSFAVTTTTEIEVDDITGFEVGQSVVIDDDDLQERSTIRAVTEGPPHIIKLRLAAGIEHEAPFRVTVEGGLTIVRGLLNDLRTFDNPRSNAFRKMLSRAGVKKVDEIEFFGTEAGFTGMNNLESIREYFRRQLAAALGLPYSRGAKSGSNSTVLY